MQGDGSAGTQSLPAPSADAVQDSSATEQQAVCQVLAGRAALGLIFLIWAWPGMSMCPLAPVPARVRRNHGEEGTGESHWKRPFACPDREQGLF